MPAAFDIIGDVHGCDAELVALMARLEHPIDPALPHPEGRRLVFVGDLVDRGPASPAVVIRVKRLAEAGRGLCVAGNHDIRLAEALRGEPVEPGHGLEVSLGQLAAESAAVREEVATFLAGLPGHLVLDDGRLVVAHAGLEENHHRSDASAAREAAIHGAYTGDFDHRAMPVRDDWASRYRGAAAVVQGHTPVAEVEWLNNTICIDTGCVYGDRLTALRWPERELVSVPAMACHARSARGPLPPRRLSPRPVARPAPPLPTAADALATLRQSAATEMARRGGKVAEDPAPDPWVIHLPPTMSPCDPAQQGDGLEHPLGAFAHYAAAGLRQVICEQKQTGLRGVAVVCRDVATAARRFGVGDGTAGAIHSRTGHRSFPAIEEASLVGAIRSATEAAGLWTSLDTDWLCLDGELVGLADASTDRSTPRFVLFHLLAAEGRTFFDREHVWHLDTLRCLCAPWADGGPLGVTSHRVIDLTRPTEVAAAIAWWHALTAIGAEGIVVKPLTLAGGGLHGPVQPALKVRGAEWLRRVYGKDYREPASLGALRDRSLATKRARALGQFAIGIEALERFVAGARRADVAACFAAHGAWVPTPGQGA
ncbi:MAG: metallophosphoesterase [Planctomycetota bacterium]|nr:metallophosphoesterase [Planctomycetota bacterium]